MASATRYARRPPVRKDTASFGHPKADEWDYDESFRPHLEVGDRSVTWSGLYDAQGEPLYHVPRPIGFGRDHE